MLSKNINFLIIIFIIAFITLKAENPYNLQPTNGPYGGYIRSFCYDSSKKDIFANTDHIYKLNRTTNRWERQFEALDTNIYNYYTMVYADSVYLMSYSQGSGDDRWGDGLIRSTDKGNSWNEIKEFYSATRSLTSLKNYLFAACGDTILKSTDYGLTWTGCKNQLDSLKPYDRSYDQIEKIQIADKDFLFLRSYNNGIYRSSNYGDSWQLISGSLPTSKQTSRTDYTAMTTTIDNKLFVASDSGIFFSTDFGDTWTEVIDGIRNFSYYNMYFLKSDPHGNVYTGSYGTGIIRLKQNDTTWEFINNGLIPISTNDLFFDDTLNTILAATDGGVYKSTNFGNKWFDYNEGINIKEYVNKVVSDKDGGIFAGTEENGIYYSSDKGNSWKTMNEGIEGCNISQLRIDSKGNIYAGTNRGNLFKSSNNGLSWDKLNLGISGSAYNILKLTTSSNDDIALDYNKNLTGVDTLIFSSDGGKIWSKINFNHHGISALIYDRNNNLFTASDSSIYRSRNNGQSWDKVFTADHHVYFINFFVSKNNSIYAGTQKDKIFKSTDGGNSWIHLEKGLPADVHISCIGSPDLENRLLSGNHFDGYSISNDSGNTWKVYTENLPPYSGMITQDLFRDFAYDGNGTLFAATVSGVYKWVDILSVPQENNEFNGLVISPNPANDFLEISVGSNGICSDQNIEIFSVLGVKLISSSLYSLPAAQYYKLDVSSLPTGIYFVKVGSQVGKFVKI